MAWGDPPALYYPGISAERAATSPSPIVFSVIPTLERFLTVKVPFEERDSEVALQAAACHETQYTAAERETLHALFAQLRGGRIYLRPALQPGEERNTILP